MALLTCPSSEWASLAKCMLPISCCQRAGDARVTSARFTGCFVFRIVSNPQVITQKIIIVHFPNILFECLLCAQSHEGLCQLSPFFLSLTPGCDSLARNEWIRFPHLACKETETQGFTVFFFFKSPVLSASSCIQLHTCNVAGTRVGTERTRWSHCLPGAHVLTEKADLKSSSEGGE